jgi:DNA-binding beta-propeller fold protein YncE
MTRHTLYVALGSQRYRIERPWGDLPAKSGSVTDVTCDARGHLFVLLRRDPYLGSDEPCVIELDQKGRRLSAFGGDIIADAHLLTAAQDGRLYVVDRDAHEVIVFDAAGNRIGGLGTRHHPGRPFSHPSDVAVARSGDVYVSDGYAGSHVHRFSPGGALLATWGGPGDGPGQFTSPHAIAVLSDGRVAVVDRENDRVQLFTPEGTFLAAWRDHYKPLGLFADDQDRLYVTDGISRLTQVSPQGALLGRCRPVMGMAHGLTIAPDGSIYLAEGNPSRLTRLVPVGEDA